MTTPEFDPTADDFAGLDEQACIDYPRVADETSEQRDDRIRSTLKGEIVTTRDEPRLFECGICAALVRANRRQIYRHYYYHVTRKGSN